MEAKQTHATDLRPDPFLPSGTKLRRLCFTGICLSTGGWGCLPQCMLGYHTPPPGADPLGADTPMEQTAPEQTPPQEQTLTPLPGADTDPPPGSRHPPLGADTPWEQTLPSWEQTPPRSRPPPKIRPLLRTVRILLECILVSIIN